MEEVAVDAVTTSGTSRMLDRRGVAFSRSDCESARFGDDPAAGTAMGAVGRSCDPLFVLSGGLGTKDKPDLEVDGLESDAVAATRCDWRKTPAITDNAEIGKWSRPPRTRGAA